MEICGTTISYNLLSRLMRFWNELEGIGVGSRDSLTKDLNARALGFRALRLHRYNVSSAVLENFKNENGLFFHSSTVEEEEVKCMLTLLRASETSFPGEKVMNEAKAFATEYLNQLLTTVDITEIGESLLREVRYALDFPRHCSMPRWEARSFIEIIGENDSWLKSTMNKKVLELAKLDFNILQSAHQRELPLVSRWWSQSDIAQQNFYRKRHVEIYFWMVIGTFEPEFSSSRIAFAKIATLMTVLDDLYDTHGTLEQLKIFTEAVKRWDLSLQDRLPDYIKITLEFFFNFSIQFIWRSCCRRSFKGQYNCLSCSRSSDRVRSDGGSFVRMVEANGFHPTLIPVPSFYPSSATALKLPNTRV